MMSRNKKYDRNSYSNIEPKNSKINENILVLDKNIQIDISNSNLNRLRLKNNKIFAVKINRKKSIVHTKKESSDETDLTKGLLM